MDTMLPCSVSMVAKLYPWCTEEEGGGGAITIAEAMAINTMMNVKVVVLAKNSNKRVERKTYINSVEKTYNIYTPRPLPQVPVRTTSCSLVYFYTQTAACVSMHESVCVCVCCVCVCCVCACVSVCVCVYVLWCVCVHRSMYCYTCTGYVTW